DVYKRQPLDVQVHVGTPEKTNTAFYYQNKIRLGSGDDVTYSKIPQDPSIVTHETAHALIDALARLPFEGEGGSLNEAFADFFTAVMLKNPNMGEVSYLKGPFRRTLNNSKTVSQKNGGLYHDSGIVSGTLWDFYNTLGEKKSLDIAVRTLSRLTPRSDFDDFRNKLKDVCSSLLNAEDLESANKILSVRGWL
ncbi:MAG: hypothetical protein N2578_02955, partial [Bdellovibrionaceae bacterium]|nr:hypothetical protein [Pseudobdellovibrionaceae bacterium]